MFFETRDNVIVIQLVVVLFVAGDESLLLNFVLNV